MKKAKATTSIPDEKGGPASEERGYGFFMR